jgi:hypothetical protein
VPDDRADISAAGQQQARAATAAGTGEPAARPDETVAPGHRDAGSPGSGSTPELDATDQRVLQALRQRDQEVRRHEQAHLLAAGPHARGGPSYTYQTGPDGQRYAVGGEVPIDLSSVPGDPQATLRKAQALRRAALAPTHPSATDQAVASKATALAMQAQQDLLQAQSAGRLTTQRAAAAPAESGVTTADSGTMSSPSATRHLCDLRCQSHDARPLPGASVATALSPIARGTKALQSYQSAARMVAP